MQPGQLLWLACCAATLWGRANGNAVEAPAPSTPAGPGGSTTATRSHAEPTRDSPADGTAGSTDPVGLRTAGTSAQPEPASPPAPHGPAEETTAGTAAPALTRSPGDTTAGTTTGTTVRTTAETTTGTARGTTAVTVAGTIAGTIAGNVMGTIEGTKPPLNSSQAPSPPGATVAAGGRASSSAQSIACRKVKDVREAEGTCLQLQEANTCEHFLDTKGSALWRAVCEEGARRVPSPCRIQLAASEVERDCLLLVLLGDTDPATDVLQKSHWEKLGIKALKRGSVRSHQDFSRKTLIALVTSGLLLALLGLAGYFLMRRRSWSPAAERLGEDPYYVESDSQGNTMVTTASAEPPEKANGGAPESGPGPAAAPNGCSAAQRGEADTEM